MTTILPFFGTVYHGWDERWETLCAEIEAEVREMVYREPAASGRYNDQRAASG